MPLTALQPPLWLSLRTSFLRKTSFCIPHCGEHSTELVEKETSPPRKIQRHFKISPLLPFPKRTEAKGLEGDGHGSPHLGRGRQKRVRRARARSECRHPLGTPGHPPHRSAAAPLLRHSQGEPCHSVPLQRRPPQPRFGSFPCAIPHRSLFRTPVRSWCPAVSTGPVPNIYPQGTARPLPAAPGWPWQRHPRRTNLPVPVNKLSC